MNIKILNKQVQDYIDNQLNSNWLDLAFKESPFKDISTRELLIQIEGKSKSKNKLPTWFALENIYYPPKIHLEQSSSEKAAVYKSNLIKHNSVADITGGFGVDCYYFSKVAKQVFHLELNAELSSIAAHNFTVLNAPVTCRNCDGIAEIKKLQVDVIYIDPSRRNSSKGKVFKLNECEPNIIAHLDYLLSYCKKLIIKTSPMLDITEGLRDLKGVNEIHIVAIDNDLKELLWIIVPNNKNDLTIKAVNIEKSKSDSIDFVLNERVNASFGLPKLYLYEPNVSLLKSGKFNHISALYSIEKLHKNTHLYTHDKRIDFPGRVFKLVQSIPYKKKILKQSIYGEKANIISKNFPLKTDSLSKLWNIKDGGEKYFIFTTLLNNEKYVLICEKIND